MDRITFETEDGVVLEGEIRLPDGPPRAPSVICHPHPQFGGSKDHPLLWGIRIELAARGFAVLSFNFRGVMGSGGSYGGGVDELKDVRAAVGRIQEEVDQDVFVCGWSFGANVALREAVDDERVRALALVAPPLDESRATLPPLPQPDRLEVFDRPVLLLAGQDDPVCPVSELEELARQLPKATVEVLTGTDHYFAKREREAGRIVAEFAETSLG